MVELEEGYKWIPGFEGDYAASDLGEICSYRGDIPRVLKPIETAFGYLRVHLYPSDGSIRHRKYVHRCVLEAFVGPASEGLECRHLDGDQKNNKLSNLAWGSHTENMADKKRHGTNSPQFGEQNAASKLTWDQVDLIRDSYMSGVANQCELGRQFGVTNPAINLIVNNKTWLRQTGTSGQ